MAHMELAKEGKVDDLVLRYFRREYMITAVGIALILLGYFMEIYFYSQTHLLTCIGTECAIE